MKLEADELTAIQNSQEAQFLRSKLHPYLAAIRQKTIDEMKFNFRDEKRSAEQLQISVGLLCALDDLENMLLRQILPGRELERKMADFQSSEAEAKKISEGRFDPYD